MIVRAGQWLAQPPQPTHLCGPSAERRGNSPGAGRGSKGYFRVTTPGFSDHQDLFDLAYEPHGVSPVLSQTPGDRQPDRAERDQDQDGVDLDGLVDPQPRVGRPDQGDQDEDDEGPGQLGQDVAGVEARLQEGHEDGDEQPGIEHLLHHHVIAEQAVIRAAVLDERSLEDLDLGLGDVEGLLGHERLEGHKVDDQHDRGRRRCSPPPAVLKTAAPSPRLFIRTAPRMRVMARTGSTMIMVTISRLAPIAAKVFRLARAPRRTETPPSVSR